MSASQHERGLVLVVALVMLLLVTLTASVSANLIMTNMQVVQNIEARSAVRAAALAAIQEAIGTPGFLPPFTAGQVRRAFTVSCKGDLYTRCLDLSGDEIEDDVTVTMTAPKSLVCTHSQSFLQLRRQSGRPPVPSRQTTLFGLRQCPIRGDSDGGG